MKLYDPFDILHTKKHFVGEPPGTIKYSGQYKDVEITIEAIIYNQETIERKKLDKIEGPFDNNSIYWFNVIGLHDMDLIKEISELFQIHHMDVEDIVHVSQWSKIEEKNNYLFSIFKMIDSKGNNITHEHVSIILKDNVLVTFQETPGDVFDDVRDRLMSGLGRVRNMDSNYLYYSLVDALVDQYFVITNRVSSIFKETEIKILENTQDNQEQLYYLRKELIYLLNAITPIKESINLFKRGESKYFYKNMSPYYTDLLEHINLIYDSLKAYKDMTNSLHEMQMSNVSNDMNKTMMTLTIFSAIFIPLSFLAGVFGMNFTYIPGLDIHSAFYFFIAACILIVLGMLTFFKIKKWY